MNPAIRTLEKQLKLKFRQPELIAQAFRHTSYANERSTQSLPHNERLEFLGDAVLEIFVSEFLYHQYPRLSEGKLTRLRAQLVREESLAYLAKQLHYDHFLQLGRGEELNGGRARHSILADCFEAVLGAIYLDLGIDCARQYLQQVMLQHHQELLSMVTQDYKTKFQELVQKKGSVTIQYRMIDQTGPAHDQSFEVSLSVDGQELTRGHGRSKKLAEMEAAKLALAYVAADGSIKRT